MLPWSWQTLAPRVAVTITSELAELPAAVDGEPVSLRTPLRISIEPGRLRLLIPASLDLFARPSSSTTFTASKLVGRGRLGLRPGQHGDDRFSARYTPRAHTTNDHGGWR